MFNKVLRNFYNRGALEVAKELIGKYLVVNIDNTYIAGRITEIEAYRGDNDKACHAYPLKKTKRTEIMFKEGGFAYVYLIYGMYYCFNIVVEEENSPCAVLIRGVDIVLGKEEASRLRYGKGLGELSKYQVKNFSDGPGKLCKAMGIDKNFNALDMLGDKIFVADKIEGIENIAIPIKTSKRIGIDYAEEAKDFLWRFYV
ncbi:MAG: DNA-3-methyladenine glycosylase [Defluviitaleaceae bacterium]|nr:DNA-3-methyladenine glycosylase [Defluviitaleaceae bacterium]